MGGSQGESKSVFCLLGGSNATRSQRKGIEHCLDSQKDHGSQDAKETGKIERSNATWG